ncbi:DUF4173 domain-containing protein [uncultured Psychroserpens sp.]|uniref:DUF4153 domain-containing protein n=1 Tax=uncultured Psychroserpens sp. TaxID=255436 RepID=UPI00260386D9|nr:DUF4173 domain-containing protein [uncultured Psychroserpens sp.]
MKHIITIIASLAFSTLFYEKHIGLNLSIFSIITIGVLAFYNLSAFKNKQTILHTFIYLVTAVIVFMQHSYLSIIANCAAFFTLIGVVSQRDTSVYIYWLNGLYTSIAGFFHRNFEASQTKEQVKPKKEIDWIHLTKLVGIPLVFIIVFVMLYKNGNPMFNNLVSQINFNFINIQWVLFSVLGYYLFSNISKPIQVEQATLADLKTTNHLNKSEHISEEKLKKEKQLGTLLLGLLNLLIVIYIITDILYLKTHDITKASTLSYQVHNGINTLIASIIIAIIIILYFFRGDLNFYVNNKNLKAVTYLWIILNIVLIALIAIKNQNYISSFGLTYKRIGVHVYIFLTLIGLVTTFIKVLNIKNLIFLFRKNAQIAFALLVILSAINWDYTITNYNLTKAKAYDIDYLIKLTNRNAVLLHNKKDDIIISNANRLRIENKYRNYLSTVRQRDWQEWSYDNIALDHNTRTK